MSNVIKFQAPFEKIKFLKHTPEAQLSQAIILQAMIDSSNYTDDEENNKITKEARNWIFGKDEYFLRYCNYAGINPDYIIKLTIKAILIQKEKWHKKSSDTNNTSQNITDYYKKTA